MPIDIERLEAHLETKDQEGVEALFAEDFGKLESADDEAVALFDFADTYVRISNSVGEKYSAALEEIISNLLKLRTAEAASVDAAKLRSVKASLKL